MYNLIYKTKGYSILLLALIVVATSCKSYKDLSELPPVETEGLIRDADADGDTTTIADVPWQEYFEDAKLQALIEEGLDHNFDMKIALTRINEAEANLSMARGAQLPSVSVGAQVDHTWLDVTNSSDESSTSSILLNQNSLAFSASWEVDLWGKLKNQARANYASYLNSIEYQNLVQTELIAGIVNAYYNLLALDEQLKITKETIVLLQKSAETIESLKNAGQQNAAAVEQSNALLYSTQLTVPEIESSIREQENAICTLLGRMPGPVDRSSLQDLEVAEELDYGVPVQLLSHRPDVKQAELNVLAAYATTNVAKASFYPSLTLSSASFGYADTDFSDFFDPQNLIANIAAGLTQPIFNQKQLKGNLKVAEAQQEEAVLTFSSTVLSAGEEVSTIIYSYQSSISKNEYRNKQINALKNAVDYTQDLLVAGEANYTEVLSAQQDFLSAQLNRVNDKLEQLTYGVNLYKALGGGAQ